MFARTNSNRIIDYVQNNEKSLIVVHSTRQIFEQILLVSFMHKCYGKLVGLSDVRRPLFWKAPPLVS